VDDPDQPSNNFPAKRPFYLRKIDSTFYILLHIVPFFVWKKVVRLRFTQKKPHSQTTETKYWAYVDKISGLPKNIHNLKLWKILNFTAITP
jgi:hypothetical protein